MKKILILAMASMPLMSFSSTFYSIITDEHNKYEEGVVVPVVPNPDKPLDYSFQPWRDVSGIDLTQFHPMAMDGSSDGQAYYKINLGHYKFKGDYAGFKGYDVNYDKDKLKNCTYINDDGFCSAGNLNQIAYDHKHSSGQYYFEVEVSGQAHADCIGLSNTTSTRVNRSDRFGICWGGTHTLGLQWDEMSTYTKYKMDGTQPDGTVYQVWIDYDKERMAVMELGSDLSSYKNYDPYIDDATVDYTSQAWMHIGTNVNLSELMPGTIDGSSKAATGFKFNFGQKAFSGDPKGFTPYDANYDASNWIGCVPNADNICQPPGGSNARYGKTHSSGKYYFEVTTAAYPNDPYVEFLGFIKNSNGGYYTSVGASRLGYYDGGGYDYTDGQDGATYLQYKKDEEHRAGSIMQIWIDYDNRLISVMELGDSKSQFENYYTPWK